MPAQDALLVVPYSRTYTQRLPWGLMYISAYLESKGLSSSIADYKGVTSEEARRLILERIGNEKPPVIGITCTGAELWVVSDLCNKIRALSPASRIVIGGPHASACPFHFSDAGLDFDYLVIGEGEVTFYELVSALTKGSAAEGIAGLAYKSGGVLKFTPARPLIADLDSLPFPAYDKIDMEYYCRPNVWAIRSVYLSSFNMFTARGCCFSCKFCAEHAVFGRKVRSMSPGRIADHIEKVLALYRVDAIYFMDEIFTVNMVKLRELFAELRKRGIKILFGCQTRANLLNEEILSFLKENGCLQVDLGVESGSSRILEIVNKQVSLEAIDSAASAFRKTGVRCLANMLVNVPGENLKDIDDSVSLVRRSRYNVVLWNVYTPFPGVAFDRVMDLEDLNTMLDYPSEKAIDTLEEKYKFGDYSLSIRGLLDRVYSETFHPKHIRFRLSPSYWTGALRMFSYILDTRYLSALARSRRKAQYLINLFRQRSAT